MAYAFLPAPQNRDQSDLSAVYRGRRRSVGRVVGQHSRGQEPTVITRPGGKAAIIISYDEYSSLRETLHVYGNRGNTRRLMNSLDEADRGEFVELNKSSTNDNL
ncbi:hypothetical protein HH310_41165 [Actinoplanes sp. TBRC 11911]|uniref:type II toxin-antitoxin system Phd/YefM family antitoxin n=1 Tax=Actinoplanes sp. TBRC 11911 TaxID=2729386 RepID=UPI00145DCCB4|nr:type II toxin-antitoxin system Phd/YefM family antitoxin [Actinoplanes sp. TBRC 11911]NMO57564.1 hypothetical protein [Actinoplanes sp. TBRC 11911]